jgi:phosphoglucomutase
MANHPLAGKPAPQEILVDVDELRKEYYARQPDISNAAQRVSFGTSGHRGSSLRGAFNEAHVLAITQAICEYRSKERINGQGAGRSHGMKQEASVTTALLRKISVIPNGPESRR